MGEILLELLPIFMAYFIGAISFSYIIGQRVAGIDIREHGSKNAGATNTLRVLGKGPAFFVLCLDAFKGIVSVLLALTISSSEWIIVLAGLFAIIGHNWPVYYGFKGGKGVATAIGVMFTLAPIPFIITAIIGLIILFFTKYVSLSSLVGAALLPFIMYLYHATLPLLIGAILVTLFTFIRHRANLVRLWHGNENKLGQKK